MRRGGGRAKRVQSGREDAGAKHARVLGLATGVSTRERCRAPEAAGRGRESGRGVGVSDQRAWGARAAACAGVTQQSEVRVCVCELVCVCVWLA